MSVAQHIAVAFIRFLYALATALCWVGLVHFGAQAMPDNPPLWSEVLLVCGSVVVAILFVRWVGAGITRWLLRRASRP
jgi:hypothetical protein